MKYILLFVSFFFIASLSKPAFGQAIQKNTQVSAFIGGKSFILFGYTSPHADVTLTGISITEQTKADKTGYFEFRNIFAPLLTQETCLIASDTLGRLSSPNCLPPFPINYEASIGPIIISPSISLNQNEYFIGDKAVLTGKTIPYTKVRLSFFKDEKKSLFTELVNNVYSLITSNKYQSYNPRLHMPFIHDVEAFSFPSLETVSDKDGNYSISVPTAQRSYLRAFVAADYQNSLPSQKSLTLNIKVFPFWMVFFQFLIRLLAALLNYFIPLIILIELAVIFFFLKSFLFSPYRIKSRSIIVYHPLALLKEDN